MRHLFYIQAPCLAGVNVNNTKATHRQVAMIETYISLETATQVSGLHANTLRRLLRTGVVRGRKTVVDGRPHWRVLTESLRQYVDGGRLFDSERRERLPRLRRNTDP